MSIRFENITKSFGSKNILKNLSFEIKEAEVFFIIGKSGVGKSVTLKQIVGLIKPDSGEIYVHERPLSALEGDELAFHRQSCGMVFQQPALLDFLTVRENISFGLMKKKLSDVEIAEKVLEKLKLVHLNEDLLPLYPSKISFGMQKRVAIARTLAPEPSILLFDEPTTSLDPMAKNAINGLIFELSRTLRVTSVVVSHDMDCALKIADRILVLEKGEILALGSPSEIKKSKNSMIQSFLMETEHDSVF